MDIEESNVLNLNLLEKSGERIKIGELTNEVIDILGIERKPCNIVMWGDRLKYSEKHKKDFKNDDDYYEAMENIPNIIQYPDYVGLHPKDGSIQYIKKINELMLVGIRLKPYGELCYRTAYPIKEYQLNSYIKSGRAKQTN